MKNLSIQLESKPKHWCREELCIFAEQAVLALFPIEPECQVPTSQPRLSVWLSYVLLRTELPDAHLFYALHLLRRLSISYAPASSSIGDYPPLFHHQLLLASLVLSGAYACDTAFTLASWKKASMEIWSVGEIEELQFEMFRVLEFKLREEGEDLDAVVRGYEMEWKATLTVHLGSSIAKSWTPVMLQRDNPERFATTLQALDVF
ncbi:hypothetical protein BT69DRAFT_1283906 [Atractiella rhizophila]|nr:hypothetical protein BT69DRAFT_1283906 [Atractiella rhizophila]